MLIKFSKLLVGIHLVQHTYRDFYWMKKYKPNGTSDWYHFKKIHKLVTKFDNNSGDFKVIKKYKIFEY